MTLAKRISTSLEGENLIQRPFVIAEAGVNHEGSINTAYRLIDEAKEGGADAIKFQTYRAETLASKNSPAYWDTSTEETKSQYQLFKKYDGFWQREFEKLKARCDLIEIEFLSTPFDSESVSFLKDLMGVFKISSSDITNKPFIDEIGKTGKPIILSTGASNLDEIAEAVKWIETAGVPFGLMHCILNYPTLDTNANLGMIVDLKTHYPGKIVGYSDHTLPGDMKNLEIATLLGAQVLEKHFTHDKTLAGNDHYHAMDKDDLILLQRRMERVFCVLGSQEKKSLEVERLARENARRSLVAQIAIKKGARVELSHLTWKRPAFGISPKHIDEVVGCRAKENIQKDDLLTWEMLEER